MLPEKENWPSIQQHPDGYQYSWFCHNYRDWTGRLDVVMRHEHRAGEKLFVEIVGAPRFFMLEETRNP